MSRTKLLEYFLLLITVFLWITVNAAAPNLPSQSPILRDDFAPPGNDILASTSSGDYSEQQVLIHLTISRSPDPNLYARFKNTRDPRVKAELKNKIQAALIAMATDLKIAETAPPSSDSPRVDDLRLRIETYPLYEYVWVEKVLRPQIRVTDRDIQAYYLRHDAAFQRPASVRFRLMYLPSAAGIPELERQKVMARIEEIHKLAENGDDFELLVQKYSTPYPGTDSDGIMEVAASTRYNRFYEEARPLKENEFSPVFQQEHGFFFLQCLEKKDPRAIPVNEVADQIRPILEAKAVRFLYTMEWEKLSREHKPTLSWVPWNEMKDDHPLIRVGKMKITKSEFWNLYPEIIPGDFTLNEVLLRKNTAYIQQFECIRADVEARSLQNHPFIIEGEKMAAGRIAARRASEQLLAPLRNVTEEQLVTYYKQNIEKFEENSWKEVKHVIGEILPTADDTGVPKPELAARMEADFLNILEKARTAVQKAHADGITTTTADGLPVFPTLLFADYLKEPSAKEYRFVIKDIGRVSRKDVPDIWPVLEPLTPGSFSQPERVSRFIYSYYIEMAQPGKQRSFEQVRDQLKAELIKANTTRAENNLRQEILGEWALEFQPAIQ